MALAQSGMAYVLGSILTPAELRENEQSITRELFRVMRPNFAPGIPETAEVQRESYTRTGVMGYELSGLARGGSLGPPLPPPAFARDAIIPAAVAPIATPAAILNTFRRVVPSLSISLMISLLSMFVPRSIWARSRVKSQGTKELKAEIHKNVSP